MSHDVFVMMLPEDGSKWAAETLEQLLRRMFDGVVPRVEFEKVRFESWPVDEREPTIRRTWTSPAKYDARVRLRQTIATHLLRGQGDGFFFFHYDGDTLWVASPTQRARQFEVDIRKGVREIVRSKHSDEATVDATLRRLIEVAPHYSIETWLFSATSTLRSKGITHPLVDAWEADLRTLDTLSMPKTALPSVDTRHYPDLARTLPIKRLRELGTSFAALLCSIEACEDLMTRLRAHQPDWAKQALADA